MLFNVFINGSDDGMGAHLLNLQVALVWEGLQARRVRLEFQTVLLSGRSSLKRTGGSSAQPGTKQRAQRGGSDSETEDGDGRMGSGLLEEKGF